MASMAVGSVAQATLGRLVGPTVASAVGGAVMQEINRREAESLASRGQEAGAGERMEEGEEFRLCSAGPMAQSVATLQEVRPSYYTPSSKQFSLVTLI